MKAAIQLTQTKGEFRVDSETIANFTGVQHKNTISLIRQYISDFEELGRVAFQTLTFETAGGKQKQEVALLNEDQSYLLLTFTRNTARVRALKVKLVKAFREVRQAAEQIKREYLPVYHELHDQIHALAAGSEKERFAHMNINRLINKTVGIGPGQRSNLPQATHSLVVVASAIAANMHRNSKDTSEGYAKTKEALQPLESCRLTERTDQ